MKQVIKSWINRETYCTHLSWSAITVLFLSGLMGPLGFAPFHMPGFIFISFAILFYSILNLSKRDSFFSGFIWGLAYFGLGVSWVLVSIHDYGQMNYLLSGLITLSFIAYLALFPACVCCLFAALNTQKKHPLLNAVLFSSLWCLSEFLRANFMTGFPWLLAGTSQIDTPLRYLAPYLGIYSLSFFSVLAACLLVISLGQSARVRLYYFTSIVCVFFIPSLLSHVSWTSVLEKPVSIVAIQANLSMRDKWDEELFYNLLTFYEQATEKLLGTELIIFPESAIPLPTSYLEEYLHQLHKKVSKGNSALLMGILQSTNEEETHYYNSIISLGKATGKHSKSHLVPFGEYIPTPFVLMNRLFNLPEPNITPEKRLQRLIKVHSHQVASLICYEIAYTSVLKQQLPKAEWIVSISDNGWFGRSFASYQQLQMSQMLSLMTGRYQVVVNNDGLSSIINTNGDVVKSLPPFSSGILQGDIYPAIGPTPWVIWGDYPILSFCLFVVLFVLGFHFYRRSLLLEN